MPREPAKDTKWLERYRGIVLTVTLTAGAVGVAIKPVWTWLIWDACAEPRVEKRLETHSAPIVEELRKIAKNQEFEHYMRMRTMPYDSIKRIEEEWTSIERNGQ